MADAEELDQLAVDPPPGETTNDPPDPDPISPEKQKALNNGWKEKEDWVKDGGDPDDWISHRQFNSRGRLFGELKKTQDNFQQLKGELEDRVNATKKYYDIQMKHQLAELEERRNEAIELGEKDKALKAQSQIDDLKSTAIETEDKKSQRDENGNTLEDKLAISEFESNNPWVMQDSPKTVYAQSRFAKYRGQGMSARDAINLVQSDVAKEFPDVNPNRDAAPTTERGQSRPGRKPTERKLSWNDLTANELKQYNAVPTGTWKDQEEFLKVVQDVRKAGG